MLARAGSEPALQRLQTAHRACHRCVDAGYLERAHPVFSGRIGQRILLVGQAPGPIEVDQSRPFAGRAGRQLMRWMVRAGFANDADVRLRVYMTAMTTCFPGKRPGGAGDRRPTTREVALCKVRIGGRTAGAAAFAQARFQAGMGVFMAEFTQSGPFSFLKLLRVSHVASPAQAAALIGLNYSSSDAISAPLPRRQLSMRRRTVSVRELPHRPGVNGFTLWLPTNGAPVGAFSRRDDRH